MKIKYSVMIVVAGLAIAAALPVQAQVLGGTLGGAGSVVLGGGGIAGDAAANGTLNGGLRDRVQAARERTQSATESTVQHGQEAADSTKAKTRNGVRKTREGTEKAAKSANSSGSATTSASAEKRIARRTVNADSSTAADHSADPSGLVLGGSQATSASMKRDEPAPEPATASN